MSRQLAHRYTLPTEHVSGGRKLCIRFREIERSYTGIRVTLDYHNAIDPTIKGVWLPLSQVSYCNGDCMRHCEIFVPVWLYRKVLPELLKEWPAETHLPEPTPVSPKRAEYLAFCQQYGIKPQDE